MSQQSDGMITACQRIAKEAKARTGFLDLGGLGLRALPPALYCLRHLRELNLGAQLLRGDETYHEAYRPWDDEVRQEYHNDITTKYIERLRQLPDLARLSLAWTPIASLTPLSSLTALQSLDCSNCVLAVLPAAVRMLPSLEKLVLFEASIPEVPAEVPSQSYDEDCLAGVRSHFEDLAAGGLPRPMSS
jgi:Leucine-rich repeat (LRR) protein